MQGWIKLHRQLTEWEWYTEPKTFKLWIHLLLTANILTHKRVYGYNLNPGQLITTLPRLAAETGLSEREVRTAIKRLSDGGEISQKTTNKFRLITIEKWGFYQIEMGGEGRQRADKGQTNDRQTTGLNKESKEFKKNNNYYRPPRPPQNRFINYKQSEWDFAEIERLEKDLRIARI